MQALVVAFLTTFGAEHGWVEKGSMRADERFSGSNINVRVPYGPTGPPQRQDNFMQRDGTPLVNLSCVRARDKRYFEVSLQFPLGNDTLSDSVSALLSAARTALRAQEVSSR